MIFFSTFLYPFVKFHGAGWRDALTIEMARGPSSSIPAVRTWAACCALEDVTMSASGPSRLAPARSIEAQRFFDSPADVWVSCDDDASMTDVRKLVAAARSTGGLVTAPCLQRDTARKVDDPGTPNVRFPPGPPDVLTGDGFELAPVTATGMGIVAVHRDAIGLMIVAYPELAVADEGTGKVFSALFLERLTGTAPQRWQGEDMSFCSRMRERGVPMHALLGADVEHAGRRMRLELDAGELAMRVFDLAAGA